MDIYTTTLKNDDTGMDKTFSKKIVTEYGNAQPQDQTIFVNEEIVYQKIDGFGVSLTEASSFLCNNYLNDTNHFFKIIFDKTEGIGLSFLRQPIGPTDHVTEPYSFVSKKADPLLESLDFHLEENEIIPLIKKAYEIADKELNVMVSPWSAPEWMKDNNSLLGIEKENGVPGFLKEEFYTTFAKYILKFIELYEENDIPIFAVTPVNEPDFANFAWPSMPMKSDQQAKFIKEYLAKEIEQSNYSPKIMCWDHNFDSFNYKDGEYVEQVYADKQAYQAIDGSAWHCYEGSPKTLTKIKQQFPEKGIWITEASGGDWGFKQWREAFIHQSKMNIDILRNYGQSIIYWNLALDTNGGPDYYYQKNQHVHSQNRGLVTVDREMKEFTFNCDYYTLGHFSKFIPIGSKRISSTNLVAKGISNVAFKTPNGDKVLVIFNETERSQSICLNTGEKDFLIELEPMSLNTIVWNYFDKAEHQQTMIFNDCQKAETVLNPNSLLLKQIEVPTEKKGLRVLVDTSYFDEGTEELIFLYEEGHSIDVSRQETFYLSGQNLRYYDGQFCKVTFYNALGETQTVLSDTMLEYNSWSKVKVFLESIMIDLTCITKIGISFLGKDRDMYLIRELGFEVPDFELARCEEI
ncbi:hypothetical protein FKZ00_07410 [Enterococcus faecalis]|uniref:glycoside hydrolase family 30 protein n=1 Tax=Enterococcus faecalis TaxID=1351 RepID=UPI0011417643|nr:glycoside hydrolase family 30 beta sandwich domain-containing protein [Enterococcus faecalis]NSW10287.1 hypothetical protein [Enterococcus faecalis]TQB30339.1 hypothetical protein FKZ00_07410 [Enterococcus faecalis]